MELNGFEICFGIGLILLIVLSIWGAKEQKKQKIVRGPENQAEDIQRQEISQEFELAKAKYYEKACFPNDAKSVFLKKKGTGFDLPEGSVYVWKADGFLNFFPAPPGRYNYTKVQNFLEKISIPLDRVYYFKEAGEVFRETKISGGGGGGGGSSLGGAIVGGVIAGPAGAIIGSRKNTKINEVKSELITHDSRETTFNYYDAKNELRTLTFMKEDFGKFLALIPEKEYNCVLASGSRNLINEKPSQKDSNAIIQQLTELSKLKEQGILTEEEFSEMKKTLLAKMK